MSSQKPTAPLAETAPATENSVEIPPNAPVEVHGDNKEPNLEAGLPSTAPPSDADTASDEIKHEDANLVAWDGPTDPNNPKNWSMKAKWRYTVTVSLFTFISPVSSSMVAPALEALGESLHSTSDVETTLALSIFILAYAVGPLIFGPSSELYGRVRILQVSNAWYFAWNLGCGFARNKAEFFVFRFLAGLGGSAPLAVGGGALKYVLASPKGTSSVCLLTRIQ